MKMIMRALFNIVISLPTLCSVLVAMLSSCESRQESASSPLPVSGGVEVADTITYNVYIRPSNPQDDFEVQCISRLDDQKLIDMIFTSIYSNGIKAYDYFDHREYTLDEIKSREVENPGYSRDNISLIQFTERWIYNDSVPSFTKQVLKIHVAYGVRDENDIVVANRPGLVIDMKN